ncbi:hypothetical protein ACQCN2_15010 [Brevibacillus ginsengisoli]|uniref:hypothetical protein n=1 Tax=Brevibacillus ginsengisoli TaxID=363854 RepID=UPI003CEC4426
MESRNEDAIYLIKKSKGEWIVSNTRYYVINQQTVHHEYWCLQRKGSNFSNTATAHQLLKRKRDIFMSLEEAEEACYIRNHTLMKRLG